MKISDTQRLALVRLKISAERAQAEYQGAINGALAGVGAPVDSSGVCLYCGIVWRDATVYADCPKCSLAAPSTLDDLPHVKPSTPSVPSPASELPRGFINPFDDPLNTARRAHESWCGGPRDHSGECVYPDPTATR